MPTQAGPVGFGAPPQQDAFGHSAMPQMGAAGGLPGGLRTSGPPLKWFAIALGLTVVGVVAAAVGMFVDFDGTKLIGLVTGVACWLLAGPVAIGALSVYSRIDTRRRSEAIYSAPTWAGKAYWGVLAVCFVGIAVGAGRIAQWAGHL